MAKVHKPDIVAQLWAEKRQEHARNARYSLYFQDDTIYSYGAHFPIARHVRHKGKQAVLMTTGTYSRTTSKHTSLVRYACSGLRVFDVHDVTAKPGKQFRNYKLRLQNLALKRKAAKTHSASHFAAREDMLDLAIEANRFAEFFGLKSRLSVLA
jgi:hypothetical protein